MALETVNKVMQAEKNAIEIEETAEVKAKEIIEQAHKKAEQITDRHREEACAKVKMREAEARGIADSLLQEAQRQSAKETENLKDSAVKNQSAVIQKITALIV